MATSSSTRRLGGATLAWPLAARAQQAERVRRVGGASRHSTHPVKEGGPNTSGPPSLSRPPVRPFIVAPKPLPLVYRRFHSEQARF
jgi:hypothetical protein